MADFTSTFAAEETPADGATFDSAKFVAGPGSWERVSTTTGACFTGVPDTYTAFRLSTSSPGGTVGSDQYAECIIQGIGTSRWFGPAVRIQGTGANQGACYAAEVTQTTEFRIYRYADAGSITDNLLSTISFTPVNGQLVRIQVVGSTIKLFVDAVEKASITDATLTGGQPGGWFYAGASTANMTSWGGGDLAAPPVTIYPENFFQVATPLSHWRRNLVTSY